MKIGDIKKNAGRVLKETDFRNLGERRKGKVRDIYVQEGRLILVATDRHSSFDRIIAHVPFKGQVLNQLSQFWFNATKDIIPNHIIEIPDPNVTVAKKCKPFPVEVVVRGYITGVTSTSLWTQYLIGKRDFGSFTLPEDLKKNQKLESPVITPTTKADIHDRPLTPTEIVSEGLVSGEMWEKIEKAALGVFARGTEVAAEAGLILVDTKYEFGEDTDGNLVLIDEIHTPDSSRYWKADSYGERFSAGKEPEYFDKEFLRIWFKEHCDPYNDPELPDAPSGLVAELARRYIEIFEQITGTKFETDLDTPIEERIKMNLNRYSV